MADGVWRKTKHKQSLGLLERQYSCCEISLGRPDGETASSEILCRIISIQLVWKLKWQLLDSGMTDCMFKSSGSLQEANPVISSYYKTKSTEEEKQEEADEKGITTLHRNWRKSCTCLWCAGTMGNLISFWLSTL